MKKILYFLPALVILAACNKETVVFEEQKVPLNISISTKAGSGDTNPAELAAVNSVRVLVFNKLTVSGTEYCVLNEFFPFGFTVEEGENGYTDISLKSLMWLNITQNKVFEVYVILNEENYTLNTGEALKAELDAIAADGESYTWQDFKDDILSVPVEYTTALTSEPSILMEGYQQASCTDAETPMNVHFTIIKDAGGTVTADNSLKRTMAFINVESITSAKSSLLPRLFVLDAQLVNVPKDMAWAADEDGEIIPTTGGGAGAMDIPLGEKNASGYYDRDWDGYVYRDVDVTMARKDVPNVRYYRTAETGNGNWGFYSPEAETGPHKFTVDISTPVEKPFGWPELRSDGKWWYYNYKDGGGKWKNDKPNEAAALQEFKKQATDAIKAQIEAYERYLIISNPVEKPYGWPELRADGKWYYYHYKNSTWKNDKKNEQESLNEFKKQATDAIKAQITAYETYISTLKTVYETSYNAAVNSEALIDKKWNDPNNSTNTVRALVGQLQTLFSGADAAFWEETKTTSVVTALAPNQPHAAYCSDETWSVNLGCGYYVPENISNAATGATAVKIKLAYAAPTISLTGVDVAEIPAPDVDAASGGTPKYYLSNSYYTKNGVLTQQEFDLEVEGTKIKQTKYGKNGAFADPAEVAFSVQELFKINAHVVNADDEVLEYTAFSDANNFRVYVDGFYRKVTGLNGTTTINNNIKDGSNFSWNIPAADNPSTSGVYEVKEFIIPVNNNINDDGDYSVYRNTKYNITLRVVPATLTAMGVSTGSASVPTSLGADTEGPDCPAIIATVTTEKLVENEE